MNYLAHLYLSGDDENLLIGNYITDGLKGNKTDQYHPRVVEGIELHRKIDHFTDSHEFFKVSVGRLRQNYGLYAGVIVDVYYDHFLAKAWNDFHLQELPTYAQEIYNLLDTTEHVLPAHSERFLWYMKKYNILVNYANLEGIQQVLEGLNYRTKGKSGMDAAIVDLKENYTEFKQDFYAFFPDLTNFVAENNRAFEESNNIRRV